LGSGSNALPAVDAPREEQSQALLEWSSRLRMPLALDDELFGAGADAMADMFGAEGSTQYDPMQSQWTHHAAEASHNSHDAWSL